MLGSCGEGIELLCSRSNGPTAALHLPLGDHMHELDAADQDARTG